MSTDWQHVLLYNNTLASETVTFRGVERKEAQKHLLFNRFTAAFVSAAHVNDLFHVRLLRSTSLNIGNLSHFEDCSPPDITSN